MIRRGFAIVIIGLIQAFALAAQSAPYRVGAEPSWVETVPYKDACIFSDDVISNGVCYLSVDIQKNVSHTLETRFHYAKQILNTVGTEEYSQINITFSPEYENVTLHRVEIIRDGKVLNRLDKKNISILRRETRMNRLMYDGNETIHIILDDVRPGDVVDYAYTVKGRNPVLKGHFFDEVVIQWDVPIQKLIYRALFPKGRPVRHKSFQTDATLAVTHTAEKDVYHIVRENLLPVSTDEGTPDWYDAYPKIQLSDMADWRDVAAWGAGLYPRAARVTGPLREKIREIAAAADDPKQRLVDALRFVQSKIRYLGIEIGAGSFAPREPATVFERRFGDCKDKSYLLVTMLRGLGIEANPALVNTGAKSTVREMLPSPSVFNHVIVAAQLDGKSIWMDPSQTAQRAPFSGLFPPDYGAALLLKEGAELTFMPRRTLPSPTKVIRETLDLSGPPEKPVPFTIKTILRDEEAINFETGLERNGFDNLKSSYLAYYESDYPDIEEAAPPVIEQTPHENRVVITEKYTIPGFWTYYEGQREYQGITQPKELSAYVNIGAPKPRTAPLGINHPINVSQTTVVTLPEDISMTPVDEREEDDALYYHHTVTQEGNVYTVKYHYASKADHVTAEAAQDHTALRVKISDSLGYTFHRSTATVATFAENVKSHMPITLLFLIVLVLTIVGAVIGARKIYRYDPAPPSASMTANRILSGWLVLFSISVVIAPLLSIYWISQMRDSFTFVSIDYFTVDTSEGYNALWLPILLFEGIYNLLFFAFTILQIVLFFKRRTSFARVFLIANLSRIAFHVADVMAVEHLMDIPADSSDTGNLMKMVLYTALWSIYLFRSERARAFFSARYGKAAEVSPPSKAPPETEASIAFEEPNPTEEPTP